VRYILRVRVLPYNRASSIDTSRMRTNRGGKIDGRVSVVSSQEAVKCAGEVLKFSYDSASRIDVPRLRERAAGHIK
jgi:hypothetical protein